MTYFVLLSLALFCVYEVVRTYLPRVPGILNVAGLLAVGWALNTFVPETYLLPLAAASVVALLDRFFGAPKR